MSSLYIDRKGTEIKYQNEALICYEEGKRVGTIPLAPIERIYIKGDVKLQASLLAKLGEKNIGVICLSGRKNIPTLFMARPHNDAARRIAQYELSNNEEFCLAFAKKLLLLKMVTQKNWLWQAANKRMDKKCILTARAEEIDNLIKKIFLQTNLPSLRGIEGRAASVYFTALSHYLPDHLKFRGRNRRPPRDPFNAVLSLAYTLIHSEAVLAIYGAGLDPYIGFFHSLDFGRESLACDMIEPLRPLIDNWLLGCFRERTLREEYFSTTNEGCMLRKTGRVQFYIEYEKVVPLWRKILTENSRTLCQLLKQYNITSHIIPQRKSSEIPQIIENPNWEKLLQSYFFNQSVMMENIDFYF